MSLLIAPRQVLFLPMRTAYRLQYLSSCKRCNRAYSRQRLHSGEKRVYFFIDIEYTCKINQSSTLIQLKSVVEFLSVFNVLLSIIASLSNALILVALRKETSLHPPTKLLFRCLAITDLFVGIILQPLFTVSLSSSVTTGMNWNVIHHINRISQASSYTLCSVSALTMMEGPSLVLWLTLRLFVVFGERTRGCSRCNSAMDFF